jgi:hypothetical protein
MHLLNYSFLKSSNDSISFTNSHNHTIFSKSQLRTTMRRANTTAPLGSKANPYPASHLDPPEILDANYKPTSPSPLPPPPPRAYIQATPIMPITFNLDPPTYPPPPYTPANTTNSLQWHAYAMLPNPAFHGYATLTRPTPLSWPTVTPLVSFIPQSGQTSQPPSGSALQAPVESQNGGRNSSPVPSSSTQGKKKSPVFLLPFYLENAPELISPLRYLQPIQPELDSAENESDAEAADNLSTVGTSGSTSTDSFSEPIAKESGKPAIEQASSTRGNYTQPTVQDVNENDGIDNEDGNGAVIFASRNGREESRRLKFRYVPPFEARDITRCRERSVQVEDLDDWVKVGEKRDEDGDVEKPRRRIRKVTFSNQIIGESGSRGEGSNGNKNRNEKEPMISGARGWKDV